MWGWHWQLVPGVRAPGEWGRVPNTVAGGKQPEAGPVPRDRGGPAAADVAMQSARGGRDSLVWPAARGRVPTPDPVPSGHSQGRQLQKPAAVCAHLQASPVVPGDTCHLLVPLVGVNVIAGASGDHSSLKGFVVMTPTFEFLNFPADVIRLFPIRSVHTDKP